MHGEEMQVILNTYVNVCNAINLLEDAGLCPEADNKKKNVGFYLCNAQDLAFHEIVLQCDLPFDANLVSFKRLLEDLIDFEGILERVFGCTEQDFLTCLEQACNIFSKMWHGGKWIPYSMSAYSQLMLFPFVVSVCNVSGVSVKVYGKPLEIDDLVQKSTCDFAKILQQPFREFSKELSRECATTLDGYLLNMFAEYTEALDLYGQDEENFVEINIKDEEEI